MEDDGDSSVELAINNGRKEELVGILIGDFVAGNGLVAWLDVDLMWFRLLRIGGVDANGDEMFGHIHTRVRSQIGRPEWVWFQIGRPECPEIQLGYIGGPTSG